MDIVDIEDIEDIEDMPRTTALETAPFVLGVFTRMPVIGRVKIFIGSMDNIYYPCRQRRQFIT